MLAILCRGDPALLSSIFGDCNHHDDDLDDEYDDDEDDEDYNGDYHHNNDNDDDDYALQGRPEAIVPHFWRY